MSVLEGPPGQCPARGDSLSGGGLSWFLYVVNHELGHSLTLLPHDVGGCSLTLMRGTYFCTGRVERAERERILGELGNNELGNNKGLFLSCHHRRLFRLARRREILLPVGRKGLQRPQRPILLMKTMRSLSVGRHRSSQMVFQSLDTRCGSKSMSAVTNTRNTMSCRVRRGRILSLSRVFVQGYTRSIFGRTPDTEEASLTRF